MSSSKNSLGITISLGSVSAHLSGGTLDLPIAGQTIVFKALHTNTTVCSAKTDVAGNVSCGINPLLLPTVIVRGGVSATFAGNALWLPATGEAGLVGSS